MPRLSGLPVRCPLLARSRRRAVARFSAWVLAAGVTAGCTGCVADPVLGDQVVGEGSGAGAENVAVDPGRSGLLCLEAAVPISRIAPIQYQHPGVRTDFAVNWRHVRGVVQDGTVPAAQSGPGRASGFGGAEVRCRLAAYPRPRAAP